MSQPSQPSQPSRKVTESHRSVTGMSQDVTAESLQSIANKGSGTQKHQTCDIPIYKKNISIKDARAGGRVRVRRVLWRRDRIVVYQHMDGRYLWADLDAAIQRPAVVVRHG